MQHTIIQIDSAQSSQARQALEAAGLRHSRLNGDCLTVPAHNDGLQVERLLKYAGVRLFSSPEIRDGSGY